MYPFLELFGVKFGMYGLCSVIGMIFSVMLCTLLGKKYGLSFESILLLMVSVGGGILIGGHLMFGLTNLSLFPKAFEILFTKGFLTFCTAIGILFGGMVYYGGFLGSVAAMLIYTHFDQKLDRKLCFDLLGVATPLFHAFGRVGCFFSGCCYGVESNWGFLITDNPLVPELNGVTRLPIALIEAACNLVIFALLLTVFLKAQPKSYSLLGIYLFLYAPTRFVTEQFRGDEIRGKLLWFTTSQWLSILLFVVSLVCFFVWLKRRKTPKAPATPLPEAEAEASSQTEA